MHNIKDYVERNFKGINTLEFQEQKNELICNMEARMSDYINEGKSEDEAFGMTVHSFGDIKQIKKLLLTIKYNKNKIAYIFSIYAYLIIVIELIIMRYLPNIYSLLGFYVPSIPMIPTITFILFFSLYPITSYLTYRKNPREYEEKVFDYAYQKKLAIVGSCLFSILFLLINYFTGIYELWSIFPIIGASNWFIGIELYNYIFKKYSV